MGKNVKNKKIKENRIQNTGFYVVQTSLAKALCGIVILQEASISFKNFIHE